jgi:hypothetical protein
MARSRSQASGPSTEDVGQQGLGLGVAWFGEYHVAEDLGGPAQVAVGKAAVAEAVRVSDPPRVRCRFLILVPNE